jgi:hypothetical protein
MFGGSRLFPVMTPNEPVGDEADKGGQFNFSLQSQF